jgi:FixJ family two-component response regulator
MVLVVDDDAAVRDALVSLLRSVGLAVRAFGSAEEMLAAAPVDAPTCLVLDVRLRGASGLDLQARLPHAEQPFSIVFISGHADVRMTATAMKAGAIDFIAKPFRDQDLLDAVFVALERERERRARDQHARALRSRFEALSPREQQVMTLAASGLLNKQIAGTVGLSEATVKIHRGQVMRKMKARTFADLVLLAQALGVIVSPDLGGRRPPVAEAGQRHDVQP